MDLVHELQPSPDSKPLHKCPEPGCGRSFLKPYNLKVHQRTVHLNEKKFVCSADFAPEDKACGRPFKTKQSLMLHVKSAHLGIPRPKRVLAPARKKKTPEEAAGGPHGESVAGASAASTKAPGKKKNSNAKRNKHDEARLQAVPQEWEKVADPALRKHLRRLAYDWEDADPLKALTAGFDDWAGNISGEGVAETEKLRNLEEEGLEDEFDVPISPGH
jgi:hypothetical protein